MQSKAASVDLYFKEIPADRLAVMKRLRQVCREELRGYRESMRYGMPSYEKNNISEVSFASQRNYISLYVLKQDVIEKYKSELEGLSLGKGCIRFTKPEKIDFGLVKKMMAARSMS